MNGEAPGVGTVLAAYGILQGLQLFILADLRARLVRLEDRALRGRA